MNLVFKNPLTPLIAGNVVYIVIHHIEADNATPEDIHKWHIENGWSGGGYNAYITKKGIVHIMRGDNIGAHCAGYNSVSYGIALEGNYQNTSDVPKAQWDALVECVKYIMNRFNAEVVPHSKLVKTDCPGKKFPMEKLLLDIKREEVKIMNVKQALQVLVDAKIIDTPEYWERVSSIIKFFDSFLIKVATYIKKSL